MILNKIKTIAQKESKFFNVKSEKNSYIINLSEDFQKMFPDEVDVYNDYVVNELRKLNENLTIYNIDNFIVVKENKKFINMNEAEYQGKDVDLNKPMRGDVKKYKVYVKDPKTGNVKKVNFGDKNMEIKRDDPERRKSFRARHKCDTAKDKTTPRYWSCKFWSNKSVSDLLNEIVEPDSIDVSNLQMKDELCPKIWDGDKLNPKVRKVLLRNAIEFIKFSKLENVKFVDIILTGSLANYNYTENSDLDVHILINFDQLSDNKEFIGEYLRNKKTLWSNKYPAKIKGHDVELYFQDISVPHTSSGYYSLIKDEWLNKPQKKMITIDTPNVQLKSAHIMNIIDELENSNDKNVPDIAKKLKERLRKMRQSGLDKDGEFSTENIVFKILRQSGYLDKLSKIEKDVLTKKLTLESKRYIITESQYNQLLKRKKNQKYNQLIK